MTHNLDILQLLLDSSFIVKLVLLLLLVASIVTWTIVFMKIFYLKKVQQEDLEFSKLFNETSDWSDLASKSHSLNASSLNYLFLKVYHELSSLKKSLNVMNDSETREYFSSRGFDLLQRTIEKSIREIEFKLTESLQLLASIGATALFVGLFGTVWGIINSFSSLAAGGSSSLNAVAPGIAEALVATAIGLAAAIPAVWFFNSLNHRVARIQDKLDIFSKSILNSVEKKVFI